MLSHAAAYTAVGHTPPLRETVGLPCWFASCAAVVDLHASASPALATHSILT